MKITDFYPKFNYETEFNGVCCFNADHPDHHPSMGIKSYRNGYFKWECKSCLIKGYDLEVELCGLIKKGQITNQTVISSDNKRTELISAEKEMPLDHRKIMIKFGKWSKQQLKHSPAIINYLEGRKLPLKYFGYVPYVPLLSVSDEVGISLSDLKKVNLVNDNGLYYANYIIFAIGSHRYGLRGFVGRTVLFNNPKVAKYKNPKVNEFYSKENVLFLEVSALKCLDSLNPKTPAKLCICEGYGDAIALIVMGEPCVVAVGGTNIGSPYHAEFIKKCLATGRIEKVIYFSDHDVTGEKMLIKANKFLKKVAGDKFVGVCEYPKKVDDHNIKDLNDLLIHGTKPYSRYFKLKELPKDPEPKKESFDIADLMLPNEVVVKSTPPISTSDVKSTPDDEVIESKPPIPEPQPAPIKKEQQFCDKKTEITVRPIKKQQKIDTSIINTDPLTPITGVFNNVKITAKNTGNWKDIGKRIITIKCLFENHVDGCRDESDVIALTLPNSKEPDVYLCERHLKNTKLFEAGYVIKKD